MTDPITRLLAELVEDDERMTRTDGGDWVASGRLRDNLPAVIAALREQASRIADLEKALSRALELVCDTAWQLTDVAERGKAHRNAALLHDVLDGRAKP